jgi:hypothetical protein
MSSVTALSVPEIPRLPYQQPAPRLPLRLFVARRGVMEGLSDLCSCIWPPPVRREKGLAVLDTLHSCVGVTTAFLDPSLGLAALPWGDLRRVAALPCAAKRFVSLKGTHLFSDHRLSRREAFDHLRGWQRRDWRCT